MFRRIRVTLNLLCGLHPYRPALRRWRARRKWRNYSLSENDRAIHHKVAETLTEFVSPRSLGLLMRQLTRFSRQINTTITDYGKESCGQICEMMRTRLLREIRDMIYPKLIYWREYTRGPVVIPEREDFDLSYDEDCEDEESIADWHRRTDREFSDDPFEIGGHIFSTTYMGDAIAGEIQDWFCASQSFVLRSHHLWGRQAYRRTSCIAICRSVCGV